MGTATIAAIAGGIVAIAKALPAARAIVDQVVVLYYSNQQRQDDSHMTEIEEEREAIVSSLKQPGMTDANRNALRRRLIALSRL